MGDVTNHHGWWVPLSHERPRSGGQNHVLRRMDGTMGRPRSGGRNHVLRRLDGTMGGGTNHHRRWVPPFHHVRWDPRA